MELIVIGSGTGVPSLRRGSPCLAVKADGRLLVLDLGAGISQGSCSSTASISPPSTSWP